MKGFGCLSLALGAAQGIARSAFYMVRSALDLSTPYLPFQAFQYSIEDFVDRYKVMDIDAVAGQPCNLLQRSALHLCCIHSQRSFGTLAAVWGIYLILTLYLA